MCDKIKMIALRICLVSALAVAAFGKYFFKKKRNFNLSIFLGGPGSMTSSHRHMIFFHWLTVLSNRYEPDDFFGRVDTPNFKSNGLKNV